MKKRDQNELNTFERTEMKRIARAVLALGLLLPGLASAANSNATMNLQGIMRDGGGALQTVPVNVTVKLYNDLNDTAALKTYNFTNVAVDNGYFTVDLDDPTIPTATQELWVGIQVAGDAAELPRQHITSVPYCFEAKHAASATTATDLQCAGTCVSDAEIAAVAASKLSGTVAIANGGTGSSTKNFVDLTTDQAMAGTKSFDVLRTPSGGGYIVTAIDAQLAAVAPSQGLVTSWNTSSGGAETRFTNVRPTTTTPGGFRFMNPVGPSTVASTTAPPIAILGQADEAALILRPLPKAITNGTVGVSVETTATTANNDGVEIKTDAATFRLSVAGSASVQTALRNSLYIYDANAAAVRFAVKPDGKVGVGTDSPSERLEVAGNVKATNVTVPSDLRLKKDISELTDSLSIITHLRPVRYALKSDSSKSIGFIAQEVEKLIPEVVFTAADGSKSMDYSKLTALLAGAVQAQQSTIQKLNRENADLRSRLDRIEMTIAKMAEAESKPKNKLASR